MRTIFLLLAISSFSLFAAADSIDYSGAGSVSAGTAHVTGSVTAHHTWGVLTQLVEINDETTGVIQQGVLGSVDIVTGTLLKCASGFCFTGGDLDIRASSGTILVKEAFTSGTVSIIGGNTFLNAVLANGATVLLKDASSNFSSDSTITSQRVTTPEASSLLLLGLGLVGLWWMGREKLMSM